MAAKRSRQTFCSAKTRFQSSSGVGYWRDVLLRAGRHVDLIDADAIGGIGEAGLQLLGVFLRLADAFGIGQIPPLGLDHGELVVAVGQHIVGDVLGGALARPLQPAEGDDLAAHPARLHHAPARRLQGGVDQLGAGFGLVHAMILHGNGVSIHTVAWIGGHGSWLGLAWLKLATEAGSEHVVGTGRFSARTIHDAVERVHVGPSPPLRELVRRRHRR